MDRRINYFSFLNVLSCFFVCAMHHNGIMHSLLYDKVWAQAYIVNVFGSFAVPVFFMLSGATLLDYRDKYSTKEFLRRRFKKVFVPFVVWQIIWFLICVLIQGKQEFMSWAGFVDGFVNCRFQRTYWFFVPLFLLYALIPVLSVIVQRKHLLQYSIALLAVMQSFMLPLLGVLDITPNESSLNGAFLPVLYAMTGYYLHKYDLSRKQEVSIYTTTLLLFLVELFVWKIDYDAVGYYTGAGLTTVLYSSSVFLLAKRFVSGRSFVDWDKLSSCSFGVYLVHMVVIYAEKRTLFYLFGLGEESFVWRIPMIIVTYLICLLLVYSYHFVTGNHR